MWCLWTHPRPRSCRLPHHHPRWLLKFIVRRPNLTGGLERYGSFPKWIIINYRFPKTIRRVQLLLKVIFIYLLYCWSTVTHDPPDTSSCKSHTKINFIERNLWLLQKTFPSLWFLGYKSVLGLQICYPHRLRKTKAKMIAKATKNTTWAPQFW